MYSAIVLPYKIAFIEDTSGVEVDICSDVILFCDVILGFFSAYIDNEDNVVKNRKVKYMIIYFVRKL